MRILRITTLAGPSLWSSTPVAVIEAEFAQREISSTAGTELNRALDRFAAADLPTLSLATLPLPDSRQSAAIFACLVTDLLRLAGANVSFWSVHPGLFEHQAIVATEMHSAKSSELAATLARILIDDVLTGRDLQFEFTLSVFRRLCARVSAAMPHLNARAIVLAARQRGVPVTSIDHQKGILDLGNGVYRQRIFGSATSLTSQIASGICHDKLLTTRFLRESGLPAPESRPVRGVQQAIDAAAEIGYPVVVKARNSGDSTGVFVDLRDADQVRRAFDSAATISPGQVIIEPHVSGREYRATVVDGNVVALIEREPPRVVGDGTHSIQELIARANDDPRRGSRKFDPLKRIVIDDKTESVLRRAGLFTDSVPHAGQTVVLKPTGHISAGGAAIDRTDDIHPDNADLLRQATRVLDIDVAGIDFIVNGAISESIWQAGGALIEINAGPGYWIHEYPSEGQSRDIGTPIVDMLFPPGKPVRAPIVAITRSACSTAVAHEVAHLLSAAGRTVGLAAADGLFVDGTQLRFADPSKPAAARKILNHPAVEIAVIEVDPAEILEYGLCFDYCDVAVVTSTSNQGPAGFPPLETVLCRTADADGTVVLSAGDPRLPELMAASRGRMMLVAGDQGDQATVVNHEAVAGVFALAEIPSGWAVTLTTAQHVKEIMQLEDRPDAAARSRLWAIAAAIGLQVPVDEAPG